MILEPTKVLFIDDKPGNWAEVISAELYPCECEISVKPNNGNTVKHIKNKRILIDKYDLIISNLYNGEEGIGILIIKEIRNNNNKIPIFVLTSGGSGSPKEMISIMNTLRDEYNVSYCGVRGENSDDFKKLCEHIKEKIMAKESVCWDKWNWANEAGSHIIPNGVVRDILRGLDDSIPDIKFNEKYRDLICQLTYPNEDWRVDAAVNMWKEVWLERKDLPDLPHSPFFVELAKKENKGEFFKKYRDHVIHTMWVYLLGMFLYNSCDRIKKSIDRVYNADEFLMAWKISALFHDIGYIFDVGIDKENEQIKSFLNILLNLINYPFRSLLSSRDYDFSIDDEVDIIKKTGLFILPKLDNLDEIEGLLQPETESKILASIEGLVSATSLGQSSNKEPLQNYYLFGKQQLPKGRDRYRDHGIISAMILLQQFYRLDYCLCRLQNKKLPESMSRRTAEILSRLVEGRVTKSYEFSILHASAAIALHNVNKDWEPDKISISKKPPYCLSLNDYHIDLEDNPLAFLLAFSDRLQCWDRIQRQWDEDISFSLLDSDVHLRASSGIVKWSVRSNGKNKQQIVSPKYEIQDMSRYLTVGGRSDLSSIVEEEEFE